MKPSANDVKWLNAMKLPTRAALWGATGCKECQNLGYPGRAGVFELWHLDEDDYDLVLGHADEHTLRQRLAGRSRDTLLRDALAIATDGTTSLAEIRKLSGLPGAPKPPCAEAVCRECGHGYFSGAKPAEVWQFRVRLRRYARACPRTVEGLPTDV